MENELGGMIENAMKDPRFAGILASLKEKADSGELDLSKLGDIVTSENGEIQKKNGEAKDIPQTSAKKRDEAEQHRRLLSALKPYLADEKKGAVDNILKISQFSGVLESLLKNGKGE